MDFMSTVKGSLLDGFYPKGWDMAKIDACCEMGVKREDFWHKDSAVHNILKRCLPKPLKFLNLSLQIDSYTSSFPPNSIPYQSFDTFRLYTFTNSSSLNFFYFSFFGICKLS